MTRQRVTYEPLENFEPDPRNPKGHALDAIGASISRFGYVEPVVVDDRTGRLVSGHGRVEQLRAMKAAGQDPPAGVERAKGSWLIPAWHWSSTSDAEAGAFIVAANRTTMLGGWDEGALAELLHEVQDSALRLEGTGFDDRDLVRFLARLADPLDAPPPPDAYTERYGVIVLCADEAAQRAVYERLTGEGLVCRVVVT